MTKKPKKIVSFPKALKLTSEESLALIGRKPYIEISAQEHELLRRVGHHSFKLYMCLVALCDDRTGVVEGATYDTLRWYLINDDLTVSARSTVRSCLLELRGVELIEFDVTTGTTAHPALGIVLPYQGPPPE